jgi:hypothetical protein
MELLHVQGPKSNIKAVGDYLRADGPFEVFHRSQARGSDFVDEENALKIKNLPQDQESPDASENRNF